MTSSSVSGEKFVDLLRRSGLLTEASLGEYVSQPSLAANPQMLASALIKGGLLTPFQAKLLLAGKHRGLLLGNYKLLDQIGRGGMGTVYLAEHTSLKRKAAVKVLANDQATTAIGTERFYREAQSAAALDHPNIVKVYDVGQFGTVHYIAMEYIEGQTLAQMIEKNGPLHFATAADYIAQAAAGLQEAGDKGFVHRDIKPENLIVDKSGTVKILDMGLTRIADNSDKNGLTAIIDPGSVVGTPDYIAPEQALNMPVDIRTDIYSLGVTFYALLTGKPPFGGSTAQKLLQHQLKEPPSLAALRTKAPPEIEPIIATMMAKKPIDRFQTPSEVIEALAPWLSQTAMMGSQTKTVAGTLTRITSRIHVPKAAPGRPKWLLPAIGGGGTLLVALVVGVALMLSGGGTPTVSTATTGGTVAGVTLKTGTEAPLPNTRDLPPIAAGALLVAAEGPEPRYATIAEALAQVKPGERKTIVVRNAVHAEQLQLTGAKHAGVTIESGFPKNQVTWLLPVGAPDKPILEVNGAEGVHIRGFKFDGQARVSDAVKLVGRCPDLILDDCTVSGFARSAVYLSGASGVEDHPLTLRKLRTVGGGETASGVLFDAGSPHANVRVIEGRFEGPLGAGVTVVGPVQGLEVRRNRFFRLKHGVEYRPPGAASAFTAQIRTNTFAETAVGIALTTIPPNPDGGGPALAVVDNLFMQCGRLASLAGVPLAPDGIPAWCWYPEFDKSTSIPAQPRYFRREFDVPAKPAGPVTLNIGVDESFTAFLNGKEIGKSEHAFFSQRVYAFDVTADLVAGANVLAIEAKNELDPFSPGFGTAAAFVVKLTEGAGVKLKTLLASDEQWKSSKSKADGWLAAGFNGGEAWVAVKPWTASNFNYPWRETVWDSAAEAYLKGQPRKLKLLVAGNARDYFSLEGYPVLESKRTTLEVAKKSLLGLDPEDDDTFLRYAANSKLAAGGVQQGPVGVPAPGQ